MIILGFGLAVYVLVAFMIYRCNVHVKATQPDLDRFLWIISFSLLALFGSILIMGILFTLNHWPGGHIQSLIGGIGTCIALVVMLFPFLRNRNKNNS